MAAGLERDRSSAFSAPESSLLAPDPDPFAIGGHGGQPSPTSSAFQDLLQSPPTFQSPARAAPALAATVCQACGRECSLEALWCQCGARLEQARLSEASPPAPVALRTPAETPQFAEYIDQALETKQPLDKYKLVGRVGIAEAGYVLCAITLVRGLFNLHEFLYPSGLVYPKDDGFSPLAPLGHALLLIWAAGDIAASCLGMQGIYGRLVGPVSVLVLWRLWCFLLTPPLLGIIIYYDDSGIGQVWAVLIAALALLMDMYLIYVGLLVVKLCDAEAEAEGGHTRIFSVRPSTTVSILRGICAPAGVPRLFWFIPLEEAIAGYILLVGAFSLYSFVSLVCFGHGTGAWAWITKTPGMRDTVWIEVLLDITGVALACVGLAAVQCHRVARSAERRDSAALQNLNQQVAFPAPMNDNRSAKKRATLVFLGFLLFSVLRFLLFVPITGVSLVVSDVCGSYVHIAALISTSRHVVSNLAPMHCAPRDICTLLIVFAVIGLDAYCLSGTYTLWSKYRSANPIVSHLDVGGRGAKTGPGGLAAPAPLRAEYAASRGAAGSGNGYGSVNM